MQRLRSLAVHFFLWINEQIPEGFVLWILFIEENLLQWGEQYGFVAFCLGLCHILHQECPHQESVYFCAVKLQDQVPLAQGLVMFQFCSVLHWCKSKVTEKNNRNVIQWKNLLAQNKIVTGKISLIVGTTYIVIELEDLIKDGSPRN